MVCFAAHQGLKSSSEGGLLVVERREVDRDAVGRGEEPAFEQA